MRSDDSLRWHGHTKRTRDKKISRCNILTFGYREMVAPCDQITNSKWVPIIVVFRRCSLIQQFIFSLLSSRNEIIHIEPCSIHWPTARLTFRKQRVEFRIIVVLFISFSFTQPLYRASRLGLYLYLYNDLVTGNSFSRIPPIWSRRYIPLVMNIELYTVYESNVAIYICFFKFRKSWFFTTFFLPSR